MTNPDSPQSTRGLLFAVALISAATLAVQVLQTRLFSVMLWHHLTYMVVTVTLLGFGFPKDEREAALETYPDKFLRPRPSDMRFQWLVVRLAADVHDRRRRQARLRGGPRGA